MAESFAPRGTPRIAPRRGSDVAGRRARTSARTSSGVRHVGGTTSYLCTIQPRGSERLDTTIRERDVVVKTICDRTIPSSGQNHPWTLVASPCVETQSCRGGASSMAPSSRSHDRQQVRPGSRSAPSAAGSGSPGRIPWYRDVRDVHGAVVRCARSSAARAGETRASADLLDCAPHRRGAATSRMRLGAKRSFPIAQLICYDWLT